MTMTMRLEEEEDAAEPTEASARISRGKDTFFTIPALLTTDAGGGEHAEEKRFHSEHAREQEDDEVGACRFSRTIRKTTQ